MLKKLLAAAAASALMLTLTACGGTGVQLETLTVPAPESSAVSGASSASSEANGSSAASTASGASAAEPTPSPRPPKAESEFEDNIDGLCEFLEYNYAVTGEPVEMSYKEIGAVGGYKYQFLFSGKTVQVEVYEFDLDNLDEKGKNCLDGVKKDGKFTVLDNEVTAMPSNNGKYIMIYTDGDNSDANKAQRERVETLFKEFKA